MGIAMGCVVLPHYLACEAPNPNSSTWKERYHRELVLMVFLVLLLKKKKKEYSHTNPQKAGHNSHAMPLCHPADQRSHRMGCGRAGF